MSDDNELRRAALMRAQAALDEELDATNTLRFEAELEADSELQRAARSARMVSAAVRRHASKEEASPALRARVLALAAAEPAPSRKPPQRSWQAALAASLVAVGFLAGFLVAQQRNSPSQSAATRSLIDAFARSAISGQAFDIASSDRHTVKPWLAATDDARRRSCRPLGCWLYAGRWSARHCRWRAGLNPCLPTSRALDRCHGAAGAECCGARRAGRGRRRISRSAVE